MSTSLKSNWTVNRSSQNNSQLNPPTLNNVFNDTEKQQDRQNNTQSVLTNSNNNAIASPSDKRLATTDQQPA